MGFKRVFNAVDLQCGIPGRVVTGGVPTIPGNSVFEQMEYLRDKDDQLRLLLLRESRGYPPMCCNLIVPAKDPRAAAGYIIMEQSEYPLMSGSNTICVATALLENGMIPMTEPVTEITLEAPAGLIGITAKCENGRVKEVKFKNVPAFAEWLDKEIDVPHLGKVTVDVAWGGMYYAMADVRQFPGLEIRPERGAELAKLCAMIRQAAEEQLPVSHPHYPGVGITISQIYGPADMPGMDGRNVVTMPSGKLDWDKPETWTGAIDRSPCGTGTCARMAAMYAKGQLKLGQPFRHGGILGNVFTGELLEETTIGSHKAVIPTLSGRAWITSYQTFVLEHDDPWQNGYTCGDIWG